MVKKYRLTIFYLFIFAHNPIRANAMHYSNNNQSTAYGAWKEVDISYDNDFPYKAGYDKQQITNCAKAIKKNRPVLRCLERVRLLRSGKIINQWLYIQSKKHFFHLNIRDLNIINMPARIIAVHTFLTDVAHNTARSNKAERVTGTFERHTANIKKYTFKDMKTGEVITINATPSHLVYVKNKASFIPINSLSSTDELINNTGQRIKLICSASHNKHCGVPLEGIAPILIYNLEINKNHTYFVSKIKLLVHNTCLAGKLEGKLTLFTKTNSEGEAEHFLMMFRIEDLMNTYGVLREVEGDNIQSDTLAILTMFHLKQDGLSVSTLEDFLRQRSTLPLSDYYQLLSKHLGRAEIREIANDEDIINMYDKAEKQIIVIQNKENTYSVAHPRRQEVQRARRPARAGFVRPPVIYLQGGAFRSATLRQLKFNQKYAEYNWIYESLGLGKPTRYFVVPFGFAPTNI